MDIVIERPALKPPPLRPGIDFALRQALPPDAEGLRGSCWPEWPVDAIREMLDRAARRTRQGTGYAVLAYHGPHVLGFGQLTRWPRTAEIGDLIVTPACRGRGIGSAIIACLVARACAWHLPAVEIGVALHNSRALALYRRLGFRDDRQVGLDLGQGYEPVLYLVRALHQEEWGYARQGGGQ